MKESNRLKLERYISSLNCPYCGKNHAVEIGFLSSGRPFVKRDSSACSPECLNWIGQVTSEELVRIENLELYQMPYEPS